MRAMQRSQRTAGDEQGLLFPSPGASKACGSYEIVHTDAFAWLDKAQPASIHAVVTDPPYGLIEYTPIQLEKMRNGEGGVWRIPPSFDGCRRRPHFLRQLVRAALPLCEGVILDPFMGSGSTFAAASACGLRSIGLEVNTTYFKLAVKAIPALAQYIPKEVNGNGAKRRRHPRWQARSPKRRSGVS